MTVSTEFELPPLWAVYDKDGNVLTTLDNAHDGSYWAYKQGLKDTYVGPYPDSGRLMLELTTDCDRCDGTGFETGAVNLFPCTTDDVPLTEEAVMSRGLKVDESRLDEAEPATECYKCHGHGYVKMGGYDGFKTQATFERAMKSGKVKKCNVCLTSGRTQYLPVLRECYTCKGKGKRPTWDASRPILPPEVERCDSATPEFMQGWLESITITVNRGRSGLTWGEAYLGLAGFGSCVDYGRSWQSDDDSIIDEVVERISSGEQYIKFMDSRTRIFAPALIIDVTPNGYSIIPANVPAMHGLGALPPTYFPTVFEEI